jgi:hypothetical protein
LLYGLCGEFQVGRILIFGGLASASTGENITALTSAAIEYARDRLAGIVGGYREAEEARGLRAASASAANRNLGARDAAIRCVLKGKSKPLLMSVRALSFALASREGGRPVPTTPL